MFIIEFFFVRIQGDFDFRLYDKLPLVLANFAKTFSRASFIPDFIFSKAFMKKDTLSPTTF